MSHLRERRYEVCVKGHYKIAAEKYRFLILDRTLGRRKLLDIDKFKLTQEEKNRKNCRNRVYFCHLLF